MAVMTFSGGWMDAAFLFDGQVRRGDTVSWSKNCLK